MFSLFSPNAEIINWSLDLTTPKLSTKDFINKNSVTVKSTTLFFHLHIYFSVSKKISPFFKELDKRLKANKKDDSAPFDFIGLPKTKSLKGLGLGNDNKKRKKDDKWFTELI